MVDTAPTNHTEPPVDGRVARRHRNQEAVLDVVLKMFTEDMMLPSIEQVSKRSGLSLRTLYRYYADPSELAEAAIKFSRVREAELAHLAHIGLGPFEERLEDFVAMRIRLWEANGAMFRASLHNSVAHPRLRDDLHDSRRRLREQFELQFAPELRELPASKRSSALEACNVLTQIDSIDLLRRLRNLTVAETTAVLTDGISALLLPSS